MYLQKNMLHKIITKTISLYIYIPHPLMGDDYMDVGGRASHGADAEGRERVNIYLNKRIEYYQTIN